MKNIITISGEPVSGKGTAVKLLKEYYEKKGMKVNIISVGNLFREIAIEEYKKRFPEVENPTIEQANNDERFAEMRKEIDLNIDSYIAQKGKDVSETLKPDEIYIFDSRLAFSNIPDSFSIRLTVDEKVAGERVFNDSQRGEEDQYESVEEAIASTKSRKEGEVERYKMRYGVDLTDENNYDLVIDTSMANPNDTVEVITKSFELKKQGKEFSKKWRNPKWFLPLQDILSTAGTGGAGLDIEQFAEMLEKNGYDYNCPIETIQVDGYYYIIEGHHRNFAMSFMGKTLLPYDVIATDDELIPEYSITARDRAYAYLKMGQTYKTMIYDHEEAFRCYNEDGKLVKDKYYYSDLYGKYPEMQTIDRDEKDENER